MSTIFISPAGVHIEVVLLQLDEARKTLQNEVKKFVLVL
jgi:hypothetical protein